jgi:cellobiose phosphorylase
MARAISTLIILTACASASAEPLVFSARCFSNEEKKINVMFSTAYIADGKLNIGYVLYENSNESIPIFLSSETENFLDEERPVEVTAKWKEIVNSKINGEYIAISQGANIYSFTYRNKSGKITKFKYNPVATTPDYSSCNWK